MDNHYGNDDLTYVQDYAYRGQGGYGSNSPQVVAQHGTNKFISQESPRWDGSSAAFDLWSKRVKDWCAATKLNANKQAYAVLASLPEKPKERLRSEMNKDRMSSQNWRAPVTPDHHLEHLLNNVYNPAVDKFAEVTNELGRAVRLSAHCYRQTVRTRRRASEQFGHRRCSSQADG